MLVVTRATLPPAPSAPIDPCFNNHNSNAIAFHRVRGFRAYAAAEWARYQGAFSRAPRRTTMADEHPPSPLRPWSVG